jgi:hypothetical protein
MILSILTVHTFQYLGTQQFLFEAGHFQEDYQRKKLENLYLYHWQVLLHFTKTI